MVPLLSLLNVAVFALATGIGATTDASESATSGASFPSLRDVTLEDLQHGFEQGCFSSTDLVEVYLERIRQVNEQVNAVTEVNPDAIDIAKRLDNERARNAIRGPLHGIPILLKNNIATLDKMNNTDQAGSYALLGATVPRDSTIARKLRQAGAVILGKANLSQWANYRSSNSTNGWSALGGQVYAAYHPKQDPSGSSSGSGVAVDLGLAFAAVGTETSGSILSPAERNNIVGIKPTVGLTSRHLVIPISEHQDTIGPMARTVKDAAHLLQAMAGQDPRDNYTLAIPFIPDYAAACDTEALDGARIGVPWNVVLTADKPEDQISSPELEAFRASIKVLQDAGAIVVEANFTIDKNPDHARNGDIVLQADFMTNLASYLDKLTSNPQELHTLAQVREFTRKTPVEQYPNRNTGLWDPIIDKLGFNNTDARFWAAYQSVLKSAQTNGILGALTRHNLSAVVLPTSLAPEWVAAIGAPGVTVPMGYFPASTAVTMEPRGELVEAGPSIPFGLSFLGRRWSEAHLIALAHGFEQRTWVRGRVRPLVMPEAEVAESAACQMPRAGYHRARVVASS
ncbi:amidase [Hirsutella rhossiliensis]|uniref:Amidase domain-containing protein n=1 Tax=Hirsutella rhossiliensis TaxID=111463 RepID=A0A9P8MU20_9HYPO|nr:amidase domain-containing protein [Hirsutella rhossiliensis]KAH0961072.1 amidase domain-containing protein [Hirsutella rhossiliensis]